MKPYVRLLCVISVLFSFDEATAGKIGGMFKKTKAFFPLKEIPIYNPIFKVDQYTVDRLTETFHFIDFNGDGYINESDLRRFFDGMTSETAKTVIREGDHTKDGTLNLQEWITLMVDIENKRKDPFFYQDMRKFIDVDGDGYVSKEEAVRFVTKEGVYNEVLSTPLVNDLMKKMDTNGDGKLSYEEFSKFITMNPREYMEMKANIG